MLKDLPEEIRKQLICTDYMIIDYLNSTIMWQGKHEGKGKSGVWYAGIKVIAGKIKRSYGWTAKRIKFLHNLGVITRVLRRKVDGHWQTNMYKLGPRIVQILKGVTAAGFAWAYHVKQTLLTGRKTLRVFKNKGIEGVLRTQLNTSKSDLSEYLASLNRHYPQDGGETA